MAQSASAKSKVISTEFKVGDTVVYPSHGVGKIVLIESQMIVGMEHKFYVVTFDKDKMTLKVPMNRAEKAGLRQLSSNDDISKALDTLKGKAKAAKGMWSKRAQEYEAKINSGDVVQISEVLRDLHRNVDDPSRSYSERVIYESAFQRFINEYSAATSVSVEDASAKVKEILEDAKILARDAA